MVVISRRIFALGLVVAIFGTWANLRASFSQNVVDNHHDKQSSSGAPLVLPSSSSWSSPPSRNGTIDPVPPLHIPPITNIPGPGNPIGNAPVLESSSLKASSPAPISLNNTNNNMTQSTGIRTKIVGFADENYKEYAVTWYRRLEALGYTEQVIVAVDQATADYLQKYPGPALRFEQLAYPPCLTAHALDTRRYRREIFARRWKYLFDQLSTNHHVLLTDVDNVFSRYLPLQDLERSEFDVYHAYSTSYPERVFWDMGFTVCGGMGWYRASPKVRQFVGTLLNKCKCWKTVDCNCYCDDQVVLNELLWKGKHSVTWDMKNESSAATGAAEDWKRKPTALNDWKWTSIEGISSKTQHKIKIWDRNVAYRAPMPESCPRDNWVSMPLYVNRSSVAKEWDHLCGSSLPN